MLKQALEPSRKPLLEASPGTLPRTWLRTSVAGADPSDEIVLGGDRGVNGVMGDAGNSAFTGSHAAAAAEAAEVDAEDTAASVAGAAR